MPAKTVVFGDIRMRMTCEFSMNMLTGIGLDGMMSFCQGKSSDGRG
jgi:hypothetical protein